MSKPATENVALTKTQIEELLHVLPQPRVKDCPVCTRWFDIREELNEALERLARR